MTKLEFGFGLAAIIGLYISYLLWEVRRAKQEAEENKLKVETNEIQKEVHSEPDSDLINYLESRDPTTKPKE